jgi:hypothetical protein
MGRAQVTRVIAGVVAVVGWAALALQLVLIVRMFGPRPGLWRYFGFFTIWSNIAVVAIASAIALGREGRLTGARARLMGLTAIVTVGFVYSLLLRSMWNPQGWQKVADAGLHDVTPILFALLWAVSAHGALRWRDVAWALAGPALYLAYALGRGAVDGWYPYYFLDLNTQGAGALLLSIVGVIAVFGIVGASAVAVDRRMAPAITASER